MKYIILFLVGLLFFVSCVKKTIEGTVIKKKHIEAQILNKIVPVITRVGNNNITTYAPILIRKDEQFILLIESSNKIKKDFPVTKEIYDSIEVGNYISLLK